MSVCLQLPSEMTINDVERCCNPKMCVLKAFEFVCWPADGDAVHKSLLASAVEKLFKEVTEQ